MSLSVLPYDETYSIPTNNVTTTETYIIEKTKHLDTNTVTLSYIFIISDVAEEISMFHKWQHYEG